MPVDTMWAIWEVYCCIRKGGMQKVTGYMAQRELRTVIPLYYKYPVRHMV
jgi:hypothetical protein